MDKVILIQYIDACKLVEETEEEIREIEKRRETIVQGTVKGSMPDFPYVEKHFHVSGLSHSAVSNLRALKKKEKILKRRKQNAAEIKQQVEEWLNTVPMKMQRIIEYKIFENMTWEEVATNIGRKATGEGIRKEFERFLKNG